MTRNINIQTLGNIIFSLFPDCSFDSHFLHELSVSQESNPDKSPANCYHIRDMNIAVLLSGGVDSSVALRLLQEQGHTVTAFYLKIWLEDELAFLGECPWEEDLKYARAVCEQAHVPLEILSMQKEYFEKVVSYTIAEVKGRTPNPDVMCNNHVKFGLF